jgi:hypothetical protein
MYTNPKPVKIIIVDTFDPRKSEYHPKPDEDSFYVASWGGLWATRIKKRYPEINIEVWRPEPEFAEITSRKSFRVDCTIFPTKGMIVSNTITIKMLGRLLRYKNQYNLVVHLQNIYDWRFNIIMPLLLPGVKIILSHHGGVFPDNSNIKGIVKRRVLKYSYRNIDSVTYLRKAVKRVVKNATPKIDIHFLPVGADFNHFKPMDKSECRRKLNLPLDKVFAVYVGRFYKLKGVDHILTLYYQLKTMNFEVLFVGGSADNEMYNDVVKSGCRHWGYVNHDMLRLIYSAADFYLHPAFDKGFGGMDVSWMEALACNIPVLTPQFKELDFDYSKMGLLLEHEGDILHKVVEMMREYPHYTKCRETALRHLDGNTSIIDKLFEIYSK